MILESAINQHNKEEIPKPKKSCIVTS